jgi:hypothetical protein
MPMTKRYALTIVLSVLALTGIRADEGRIPVFQATTITQPGHYVLTSDFTVAGLTAITIAADDVQLDLNGRTITSTGSCSPGLFLTGMIHINLTGAPRRGIVIRNGRLKEPACAGISTTSTPSAGMLDLRVEDVQVIGPVSYGIALDGARNVEILGCHIHDVGESAILLDGNGPFGARIIDNIIEGTVGEGIYGFGLNGGQIRGNVITNYGDIPGGRVAILLDSFDGMTVVGGNVIEGNTINPLPSTISEYGIHVRANSRNNVVVGNIVSRTTSHGIVVEADGTRIERNVTSRCGGDGIRIGLFGVNPSRTLVDNNQAQDNTGCGVNFANAGAHAYRNNMLRGNTGGGVCGAANTDAGGNIL